MAISDWVGLGIVGVGGYIVLTKWGELEEWFAEFGVSGELRTLAKQIEEAKPIPLGMGRVMIKVKVSMDVVTYAIDVVTYAIAAGTYPKGHVEDTLNVCADGELQILSEWDKGWFYIDLPVGVRMLYVQPKHMRSDATRVTVVEGRTVSVQFSLNSSVLNIFELSECPTVGEEKEAVEAAEEAAKETTCTQRIICRAGYAFLKGAAIHVEDEVGIAQVYQLGADDNAIKVTLMTGKEYSVWATKIGYKTSDRQTFTAPNIIPITIWMTKCAEGEEGAAPPEPEPEPEPEPAEFVVTIKGVPDSRIKLDGVWTGLQISSAGMVALTVVEGKHTFTAQTHSGAVKSGTWNITSDRTIDLTPTAELVRRVTFKSVPAGATLYVDEKWHGGTPTSMDLSIKTNHSVKLSKSGYKDISFTYNPPNTTPATISKTLTKISEPAVTPIITPTVTPTVPVTVKPAEKDTTVSQVLVRSAQNKYTPYATLILQGSVRNKSGVGLDGKYVNISVQYTKLGLFGLGGEVIAGRFGYATTDSNGDYIISGSTQGFEGTITLTANSEGVIDVLDMPRGTAW